MECKFCGKPATLEMGGTALCEECYHNAGSCCREFGADDLWREKDEENDVTGGPGADPQASPVQGASPSSPATRDARGRSFE